MFSSARNGVQLLGGGEKEERDREEGRDDGKEESAVRRKEGGKGNVILELEQFDWF